MAHEIRTPAGKFTFFSGEVLRSLDDRIERAMRQTVLLVENRVKVLQTGSRHGRFYRIGKTPTKANRAMGIKSGRWYQASAPGEPPAIKSSRLFKSITSRVEAIASGLGVGWKGSVGTNVGHAPYLEFGVKGSPRSHVTRRRYRVTKTREHTGEQGVIVRVQRVLKGVTHVPLEGPHPAGGWRLAPRPLWRRAMMDLINEIKSIWAAAAGRPS